MTRLPICALLLITLAATAGCWREHPDDDGKRITRHIAVHDEGVIARTRWGKPALIGPDGALSIGGTAVPLDAAQRQLAKRYHDHAVALYADALGLSGAPGAEPVEPDAGVGDDIPAATATAIEPGAGRGPLPRRICERIDALEAAQDALADATPAFRPHATLPGGGGEQCLSAMDPAAVR